MARKTQQEKQETYRKLLESASTLFIEQGVASTTLNQIALHAGMTRGALYWHFENKDAIIQALWEQGAGSIQRETINILKSLDAQSTVTEFRDIIHGMVARVFDDPEFSRSLRILMHCMEFSDTLTPLNDFLMARHMEYADGLMAGFRQMRENGYVTCHLSNETLAGGLLSYLFGLLHHHLEPCRKINLEEDARDLVDIYLNGVLQPA